MSLIVALVASVGLLSSCLKTGDPLPERIGGITFVNTFIEAEAVSYLVDRNPVMGLNPIRYRNYGPQWALYMYPGEDRRLEIYSSHRNEKLVDTTFTVQDSVFYSSFVFGTVDEPRHYITEDRIPEDTADPATISAVRFFNLANTERRMTLHIGDLEPVEAFSSRPLETAATGKVGEAFLPVTIGTYTISVVDETGETVATRQGTLDLFAGRYTTIFLTGDERDPKTFYVGVARHWVN